MLFYYFAGAFLLYVALTVYFTHLVHRIPRKPVADIPDWGDVVDTRIPSVDGGSLEVWRVEPEGPSRGVVLLAHGWSRNRGRMVHRARIFGQLGFTTVMHSARDHGNSSKYRYMNAFRFAEDMEAVLKWIDEPVLLYGHSAGAAGAIIVARKHPDKIRLLFLEGCYARTQEALKGLYRSYNHFFGLFFAPMVVFTMNILYGFKLDKISPALLAEGLDIRVLLIHGELDKSFPLRNAWILRDSFPAGRAELFVGIGSDHSDSSLTPEYPIAIKAFVDRHLKEPD